MFRIARLFLALGASQLGDLRGQAVRQAVGYGLIGFFALLAIGFGLVAATAALAARLGLIEACLIMGGGALGALLIVLIVLDVSRRQYRVRARERAAQRERLSDVAMLAAFGPSRRPRPGRLVGLGLLAAAVMLLVGRRRRADND